MSTPLPILIGLTAFAGILCRSRPPEEPARDPSNVVRQTERNTCGPAALSMLLAAHGRMVPESTLAREMRPGSDGVSLSTIVTCARSHGVELDAWRLRFDTLSSIETPAILWVDGDHFVVFDSVGTGGVHLRDPSAGRCVEPLERFRLRWDGTAAVRRAPS